MKKILQEYIKLEISKILSEGFYENPMTTIQDVLDSFSGRTLIFFDTETTGLSGTQSFSQIIEIAAVAFDDQAKQLAQYHYKTKLNPEVFKRIEQEKNKKRKQQVIDSRREEIKNYKEGLTKLKEVLEKIESEIKNRIVSKNIQSSLEKLRKKLFVKIENLINPPEKNILESAIKESVEFDIKKQIEDLVSKYQILTNFLNSIPSDSPLETEKQISKKIENYLNKIQNVIFIKNEWEQKWKSIEDILDMTQYHESNAEVISEREALQGFKQFIDSFPNPLLIAHNATFDMMQINNGMKRYNLGYIPKDMQVLDTVKLVENYIKPLLRILKGGNPTEKTKRLIVALSFQTKDIKEMDIEQYKQFIDNQNIEDIYKNVTKLFGSLKHLTVGLNVELKNWHSAVADAEALSKVLLNLSQIMYKYKHFEDQFEMQRKRAGQLGYQRQRELEKAKKKEDKKKA